MADANVRNELCNFILLQLNYARRDFSTSEIAAHLDRREKCLLSKELARLLSDGQLSRTGKERYHITGGIASFRRYLLSCTERESPTALEMPEDHLSLDDIMRATWHMIDLPKELSTIESDDDNDDDDDDIDWLLAEEFDADKSSSEEHCENKEVIPSKVFEEDSPSHEKEEIPSHDLWKDSKQFEEIVMVVIEDIIVADLTMTREEAVERAAHYNDYVRDALGERMAQVYDRARYEFLTASDAEFDILRETLRRK